MGRTNLHQGYGTLLAAKAFITLDIDTKGATNSDGTKTIEEELTELKGVNFFDIEEFSSREESKRRRDIAEVNYLKYIESDEYSSIAENGSNFNNNDINKVDTN